MKVLVTGAAGFIGYHVSERLLSRGDTVVGVDNLQPGPDEALKLERLSRLQEVEGFHFHRLDVRDEEGGRALFGTEKPDWVVHLAARVGVRSSAGEAAEYTSTNVGGTMQVLERSREAGVKHVVLASSSSVYGEGTTAPFSEEVAADKPVSLYAATKRAAEMLAHASSVTHGLPVTCLRFFTVYGPWGRLDMAPLLFLRALLEDRPVRLHGQGRMYRDFTYVGDVAEAVDRVLEKAPEGPAPFRVLNVGYGDPVQISRLLELLEERVGRKARVDTWPAEPGEMDVTWADVRALVRETGFRPSVSLEEGLPRMVSWYRGLGG